MEFTLQTSLPASAKKIYDTWLSSDGHSEMTGGEAIVSDKVDETFTAWDDYISGKNVLLEKNKRIVQTWRTTQFTKEEPNSQIEILLQENEGETMLTLHHTNVPESGEHYKKGWEEHYFQPMKDYFSKSKFSE